MPAVDFPSSRKREQGTASVEFAIGATAFLMLVFGMVEISRAMYLWNTLAHSTHIAARNVAAVDFNDSSTIRALLDRAVFKTEGRSLPMGGAIDGSVLKVSYLTADGVTKVPSMPLCPGENVANCTRNPDGPSCIRFVRVQLCGAATSGDGSCPANVPFEPMIAFEGLFAKGAITYPNFTAVVPAGTLGYKPGSPGSCP